MDKKKQEFTNQAVGRKSGLKDDEPKGPPSSQIGADKSPFAAESSKRPYSSAAR